MTTSRAKKAKLNIIVSILCQIVNAVCGIVLPKILLGAFGSEAYGATSSITHFLAYITLLEGGISGVARAALYKPLAENDTHGISEVIAEIKKFFRTLGIVFVVYVLVLACSFKEISHTEVLDWASSFLLVLVISISTFGQYFIGISNTILLQAAQQKYITYIVTIAAVILNTVLSFVLVKLGCGLIMVKLVSSFVFVLRPVALWIYVKRHFKLTKVEKSNTRALSQKWTALGQHIAYFLHSNTDVAVLTVMIDLVTVSIYSVYHMVVMQIQNMSVSFTAGMESLFGDMLAKGENEKINKVFGYYETMISMVSVIMFAVTSVLIVPFVKLYTANVQDADYIQPVFAILMVIASFVYCLRLPYHYVVVAAGHFRQTRAAAYGEAALNIVLSILLVYKFGLIGVAIGTVAANLYRFIFYIKYLAHNIIMRPIRWCLRRELINCVDFALIVFIGSALISIVQIGNYYIWVVSGVIITAVAVAIVFMSNWIFYKSDFRPILQRIMKKINR